MTQLRQLYRCNVCGNVVEVLNEGAPDLHCCGELMGELEAKTEDAGLEKHVPVMDIEVMTSGKVARAELKPGDKPEAAFSFKKNEITGVREFCTVHMLWKA